MRDDEFYADFAVFILTHGRPDKCITYRLLRKLGYKGRIYLILDDSDKSIEQYRTNFSESEIIVFSKKDYAGRFDIADNFTDYRGVVYARNASFDIAEKLGIDYFLMLDDDYTSFQFKFNDQYDFSNKMCSDIVPVLKATLKFFIESKIKCVAWGQGGDYIGGKNGGMGRAVRTKRKVMNSFFLSPKRRFDFVGRINEDVCTYVNEGKGAEIMFTLSQFALNQVTTQKSSGGLTEQYLDIGTYVKSFYTVIFNPSAVTIRLMGTSYQRLHHFVDWKALTPMIVRESLKKPRASQIS